MIMLMFAEDLCDSAAIKAVIMREAYKAQQKYPSRFSDVEDLIQIGRIAAWKAKKSWRSDKASFATYARVCIANAMRRAAIASTCALSASHAEKLLAFKMRARLRGGQSPFTVRNVLKISEEESRGFSLLVSRGLPLHQFIEENGRDEEPYSTLHDMLSVKDLTDEERQIIMSKVHGMTGKLGIPATSLQRRLAVIWRKLVRGGYANES